LSFTLHYIYNITSQMRPSGSKVPTLTVFLALNLFYLLNSCFLVAGWCRHILHITATVQLPNHSCELPAKLSTKNWFLYGIDRVSP